MTQCTARGTCPDPAAVTSLLPKDSLTLPLRCQVCGDAASGNHFGVLSCEGCKGFYRRTVCNLRSYSCARMQNCIIEKNTRNKCKQCRLRKCIAAGMKMESEYIFIRSSFWCRPIDDCAAARILSNVLRNKPLW